MKGNVIETVMGAVVLVVAALFLFFAYNTSQLRSVKGYELTADFERIDGIRDGGDVRVSGIKIGSIVAQTLDPKTFLARLQLSVDPSVKLPDDTVAKRPPISRASRKRIPRHRPRRPSGRMANRPPARDI